MHTSAFTSIFINFMHPHACLRRDITCNQSWFILFGMRICTISMQRISPKVFL